MLVYHYRCKKVIVTQNIFSSSILPAAGVNMKLVECVPNFSEGKDKGIIDGITGEIKSVEGITLKDVDMGADMNRTVVTLVGSPEAVEEAAFRGIKAAHELIDMSKQTGSHPRMGATDVCPLVPVENVSMEECIEMANRVGKRVADELGIPVYLYEEAATEEKRRNLAVIRAGQYEGLEEKLKDPAWKPDFGPVEYTDVVKRSGATAIGAREFLIAYNINLNTRQTKIAWDIAFEIRDKGRAKRDDGPGGHYWKGDIVRYDDDSYPCGECDYVGKSFEEVKKHTKDEHGYDLQEFLQEHYDYDVTDLKGKAVKKKGKFPHCKAIGWFVDDFDRAQISINLTNYKITSIHEVYEAAKEVGQDMGVAVTGSEIVGLVPYNALLEAGKFYLKKQKQPTGIPYMDILETAVQSLGLRDVTDFDVEDKVIGLPTVTEDALVAMRTDEFVHELSRDSATPGGGSVAALSGAMGAGLLSMVCNLSTGGRDTEEKDPILIPVAEELQELKDSLLKAVDEDTNAFDDYMAAKKMPKGTVEERKTRKKAMKEGLKNAVEVPLCTAELSGKVIDAADAVAEHGKSSAASDALVGAQMAFSGVVGGIANVRINLKDMDDQDYISSMESRCESLHGEYLDKLHKVIDMVEKKV